MPHHVRTQRPSCPRCDAYLPGHRVHPIQLRLLAERPQQWHTAVVVARGERELTVEDARDGRVILWHHADIDPGLVPGDLVQHHALNVLVLPDGTTLCVAHVAGGWAAPTETFGGRITALAEMATGDGAVIAEA